jgi:ABC-type bacteriocin/lantibiotic exporter with double-glycine peptidase domain
MENIKKYYYILTLKERKQVLKIFFIVLFITFLEIAGIGSIFPFVAILSNPEIIETNNQINFLFKFSAILGIETKREFIVLSGSIFFLILLMTLTLRAATTYLQVHFSSICQYNLSKRLIEGYLNKPYIWFLNRNITELGKNILTEVGTLVGNGLAPLINILVQSILVIFILTLLIYVQNELAIFSGLTLFFFYFIVYKFFFNTLKKASESRYKSNQSRFVAVNEALSAVKEIKLASLEKIYIDRFANPAKTYASDQAILQVIGKLPRYAIEAFTFGSIILAIFISTNINANFIDTLPTLALYILAGYRLLPALQQIYLSITQLRSTATVIDAVFEDLTKLEKLKIKKNNNDITFNKKLILKNINFQYPDASRMTLKNINLIIPAFSKIGFVGHTGCGKTTIVDIILGLLNPKSGNLQVDGKLINKKNIKSWQSLMGYVPQNIYLANDTITSNIAFGESLKNINYKRVETVAKIANLHEFIMKELNLGYQTIVGDRGVRLSGGQRQRIGIARGLYHDPKILVLDEATNALDNNTEKLVMNSIFNISNKKTLICISHRLNTLKKCDKIFLINKGKIEDQGTYEQLSKNSSFFN